MPSNTGNLLAFGEDIVGGFSGEGGGGSGGHTILNPSGTVMTQRPDMQFKGMKVSDNSTDEVTEVDASPDNYTWDQWIAMTDEQREAIPSAVISGLPDVDGEIEVNCIKVLWQNNSYTTAFPPGNITLNSDDYDFIWVDYLWSINNFRRYPMSLIPKGQSAMIEASGSTSNGVGLLYREFTYVSATTYQFGDCKWKDMNTAEQTLNQYLIPYRIYGIKTNPSVKISAIAANVSTEASKCMLDENTSVADVLINQPTDTSITRIITNVVNGILIVDYSGIVVASNPNTWITCGVLPAGYRPSQNAYSVALNSQGQMALIYVNTAGELQIRATQVNSQYGYYGQIVVKI